MSLRDVKDRTAGCAGALRRTGGRCNVRAGAVGGRAAKEKRVEHRSQVLVDTSLTLVCLAAIMTIKSKD